MDHSKFKMHGALTLVLHKENGEKEVTHKDNIIVDVGFDFIANAIANSSNQPDAMGFVAVGTGTTSADPAQAALVAEIMRSACAYSHTPGSKVFSVTSTFAAGVATGAITESGVFNAASAGIMLDRVTFPVVNKGANDSMDAQFTFTMS